MVSREKEITLNIGLSSRTIYGLVSGVGKLKSNCYIEKIGEERTANLKSIIGVISLDCHYGDKIKLIVVGNSDEMVDNDLAEFEKLLISLGDK